jgi:RHS repeat-associated protein
MTSSKPYHLKSTVFSTVSSYDYRFGFNGKENDNEVKGFGSQQDYGLRIYDTRLGRFLSVDPLADSYPWYTPYQFAGNMPIANVDLDGGEPKAAGKDGEIQQAPVQGHDDWGAKNWISLDGQWNLSPTKETVNITEQKSKASQEWISYISSIGVNGYNDFINTLYQSKLSQYTSPTQLNIGIYGQNSDGSVAVPNSLKEQLFQQANSEALPALKQAWAMQQSGIDPNSMNFMFNPIARAGYYSSLALTVSSTKEGWAILGTATIDVALTWSCRFAYNNNPFRGYGLFGKDGKIIRNYKLEAMYADRSGGGTYFSIKQMKNNGASIRLDWGAHGGTSNYYHPHVRFYTFGKKIGKSKPLW